MQYKYVITHYTNAWLSQTAYDFSEAIQQLLIKLKSLDTSPLNEIQDAAGQIRLNKSPATDENKPIPRAAGCSISQMAFTDFVLLNKSCCGLI